MTTKIKRKKEYLKALQTFNSLRWHPLAITSLSRKEQYIIEFLKEDCEECGIEEKIIVTLEFDLYKKLNSIFPIFATAEDAEQAIKDIGEANLVYMSKTLKGIYEDE